MTTPNEPVEIYTDGACSGNPGPGGWAAVLQWRDFEKRVTGGEKRTTNNAMELMAAIAGLEALNRGSNVRVWTDSTYVRDGITRWIKGWKRNGWLTKAKKPVKNMELWQRLDRACLRHSVDWRWVKGHSGHPGNELADTLAREAVPRR